MMDLQGVEKSVEFSWAASCRAKPRRFVFFEHASYVFFFVFVSTLC